jgi:cell division topological specificity factor
MSMFNLFRRRGTAPVARDRLQILLAHERVAARGQSDLLAILRDEILAVIAKHVTVERDNVVVRVDRGDTVSTLEIDIEIPTSAGTTLSVGKTERCRMAQATAPILDSTITSVRCGAAIRPELKDKRTFQ